MGARSRGNWTDGLQGLHDAWRTVQCVPITCTYDCEMCSMYKRLGDIGETVLRLVTWICGLLALIPILLKAYLVHRIRLFEQNRI